MHSPEFDSIIARGRSGTMTSTEVAALATRLADSGSRLNWESGPPVVDLASTGGPGSLSTLLAPLELRRLGCRVVKLGVPGRPAGGIDVLGTVPGYATQLSEENVRRVIDRCGYAHFLADEHFAPMDASLFAYRHEYGAVAVPPLAAASLLSKKLAMGLQAVGLDVRVGPHGNFGATMDEARVNALLFCEAARLLDIEAVAFLFESSGPEQPWIGRGESLAAVDAVLDGSADGDLAAHAIRCFAMAAEVVRVAGMAVDTSDGGYRDDDSDGRRSVLEGHLSAQGASLRAFRARVTEVTGTPRRAVLAGMHGTTSIDIVSLRDALVDAQREVEVIRACSRQFADPAGVVLRRSQGEPVLTGDLLAEVRVSPHGAAKWIHRIEAAIAVHPHGDAAPGSIPMEIVRA